MLDLNFKADILSSEEISEAIRWRHHLHRHPELAFEERETADFVARLLGQWGLSVHSGLGGTGVVGTLSRGTSRRTIALRADMDALPIAEETSAPYASRMPGRMHACGHDGHMAMLLAAARACSRDPDLDGTAHFIFQPAEENGGGALKMIEDGLFSRFPSDRVFGLHNWPAIEMGACVARDAAMMAASGMFEISITGRGSHGAMPDEGIDPIPATCAIVSALQTIVSRNVSPLEAAVVSVTQIQAGDTWNVIPQSSIVRGTTRWFNEGVGSTLETKICSLATSIARGFGCKADLSYAHRFPATINNAAEAAMVRRVAAGPGLNLKVRDAAPSMAAEDFAYMLQAVPGCYFWLGSRKAGDNPVLHSPRFDFNDAILRLGAQVWVHLVRETLSPAAHTTGLHN